MNPEKRYRYIKYGLATIAILVALAFCVGIIYAVVDYYTNNCEDTVTQGQTTTPSQTTSSSSDGGTVNPEVTGGNVLDYFTHANDDGLYVIFVHGANSIAEMNEALSDESINMLEADITLRYYGLENQTTEPIMAHPPSFNSDNTLANWFENVIPSKKGIKMDMKVEDAIPYALAELKSRGPEVNQPVWINADVMKGPNTPSEPINGTYLIENVNKFFPNLTLSLGWTTGYRFALENDEYSWESMDYALSLASTTPQRITFCLRAALARQSWYKFLWLLEQKERFTLTVWSGTTDPVNLEDKMFLRDNYDPSKVFYDTGTGFVDDIIKEAGERTTEKVFYTGGNVLGFLRIPGRDAIEVTWAHRANNKADLEAALKDTTVMMLEADVRLRPDGVPIMAHTSVDIPFSDQTLEEWLQRVANETTRGMKLDVKVTNALEPSFNILKSMGSQLKVPIWLNSDVLRGPNSVSIPVNASVFFNTADDVYPHCTLSPGWTTAYNPIGENKWYTQEMVEEMYSYCRNSRQAITFPVRASLTGNSIGPLKWLLDKSNRYTLTVWHSGSENVLTEDLVAIRNNFRTDQVYYDLPEDMMKEFQSALENQS